MKAVFIDTSAVLALLVATDRAHALAAQAWQRLEREEAPLLTTSYVLVETYALLDRRVGPDAVRRFRDEFEPLMEIVWVGAAEHRAGLDRCDAGPRGLSLVDAVSFVVARARGIVRTFAFDNHFAEEGLEPV
jgi:predicted nucleic acid-binding protein